MKRQKFTRSVVLRPARVADAAFLVGLRTDPRLNAYLNPVSSDVRSQEEWLRAYEEREAADEEYYFIIVSNDDEELGAIRLYNIDRSADRFEVGSWIIKPGAPRSTGLESMIAIYEFGFGELGFTVACLETMRGNKRVQASQFRFGGRITGEDEHKFYFELRAKDWQEVRKRYSRFLRN